MSCYNNILNYFKNIFYQLPVNNYLCLIKIFDNNNNLLKSFQTENYLIDAQANNRYIYFDINSIQKLFQFDRNITVTLFKKDTLLQLALFNLKLSELSNKENNIKGIIHYESIINHPEKTTDNIILRTSSRTQKIHLIYNFCI